MKLFNLPNILTLVNLFAGCVALVLVFSPGGLEYVPYFTIASLIADYLDGMAARFTNSHSLIGKELDSLADVVSFGVVPSAILYTLLTFYFRSVGTGETEWQVMAWSSPAFLMALFSALRLAKFNLDERQTEGFIGLATTANAIFIMGLLFVFIRNDYHLSAVILNPYLIFGIVLSTSLLLIAEIPMFSFKFKNFGWRGNEIRFMFIIAALVMLTAFKFAGISLTVILYVVVSVLLMLFRPERKESVKE